MTTSHPAHGEEAFEVEIDATGRVFLKITAFSKPANWIYRVGGPVTRAAQSAGAYTPMGGEAEELYQRFVDRGGGHKDFSAIIKMIDDSWTPDANTKP